MMTNPASLYFKYLLLLSLHLMTAYIYTNLGAMCSGADYVESYYDMRVLDLEAL